MGTYLSNYYRDCRLEKQLSHQKLARLCGYQNLTKGARRIQDFERTGQVHAELLNSMTRVLQVDPHKVQSLRVQDDQEAQAQQDRPFTPRVIVRLMPAVYVPWNIEEPITSRVAAASYCRELAQTMQKRVALLWSHQTTIFFDERGRAFSVSRQDHTRKPIPRLNVGGDNLLL